MNASAEQIEPVAAILPLSPRWEDEKAPLPPPTTRLALNLRLKALRERVAMADRRHAETMAALEQREADVEALGRPRAAEKPAPKQHRRPGPIFEGASWMAEHGLDWKAEGKAAREAFYADVDERTWASVEAARDLGPEATAALNLPLRPRRVRAEAPVPVEAPIADEKGQLLLFVPAEPPPQPDKKKPSRRSRSRVPQVQLALLEPPSGPAQVPRVNLLRFA